MSSALDEVYDKAFSQGFRLRDSMAHIDSACLAVRLSLNHIADTYYTTELFPVSQRAAVRRELFSSFSSQDQGKQRADVGLLSAVGALDTVIKGHEPVLQVFGLFIDRAELNLLLAHVQNFRTGIQALLRENNPDDGETLRQAIGQYGSGAFESNLLAVGQAWESFSHPGRPSGNEVTAKAGELLRRAMNESDLSKGKRGYRAGVRKRAISLLCRECNVRDVDDLRGRDQEVYQYLKSLDDSMITRLLHV
jgi:hypothetical protein